jgi:hypothetical protein
MPSPYLSKLAKKHHMSNDTAEGHWAKAKARAAEQGHEGNYAYITAIAKKMMGESEDGRAKLIRELIEDIKAGRIDPDEASSILMEMVSSGSVGGFIAGGLVQGYTGTPFPTGTRDRNGIPNKPSWGNAAEQKSAKNLPGRKKKHHKKRRKHHRVHECGSPHEVHAYHTGAANWHWRQGDLVGAKKHRKAAEATGIRPSTYDKRFASPEMDATSDAAYQRGEKDAAAGVAKA